MGTNINISKKDIITGLSRLGIKSGMRLIVHSSMKSFGMHVKGGPVTVIQALQEVLEEKGILMMPSFCHDDPFLPGGAGCYDPLATPTSTGTIAQTFWQMSNVRRSLHPTHSFAVWGDNAMEYIENHPRTLAMGIESPMGRLYSNDGFCLFIGHVERNNTFHHVVETMNNAPCLGKRSEQHSMKLPDGRIVLSRTWGWRAAKCTINDGGGLYVDDLKKIQRRTMVGNSQFSLYRLKDGFEIILKYLRKGAGKYPPCHRCSIRPRRSKWTVKSDWDENKNELKPDSIAWSY